MMQQVAQKRAIAFYNSMRVKTPAEDHLELIRERLDSIEAGTISKDKQYQFLVSIAYHIANACNSGLQQDNIVYKKYAMLHMHIPVSEGEESENYVSAEELDKAKNWLRFAENGEKDREQKEFFEKRFECVHTSLKRIFKEVKKEIVNG